MTPIVEHAAASLALSTEWLEEHPQPIVIRGLVDQWPIVQAARQSDSVFAKALAAMDSGESVDVRVMQPAADGVVGYADDFSAFSFSHFQVPLTEGLKRLGRISHVRDGTGVAIQSAKVARCLPGFMTAHRLAFLAPNIEPRIWIGNHVTTPAHSDSMYNVACVVCGKRRFTLFPPDQAANLYLGPPDFAPTGTAISMARIDRPDDPRFPRLREALAVAQVAELEPGDAIYIPPMWWHNVESLCQLNALVNYWWLPAFSPGYELDCQAAAMYHCILAFRHLPPAQREAWRGLLHHYVFADDDPIAHVPAALHGVLSVPPSVEQVAQLKRLARSCLDDEAGLQA
ncbi:MAG TPA: cupin-like domain-containing protein [Rhodanobacteraceae bacterium]